MALTLKSTGIATNCVAALVNDAGTIKLFRYGTSTLTVGSGLTVAGTITAEASPTTYNGNSVYEMTVAASSRLTIDSAIAGWAWAQANGVAAFAAFTSLTADGSTHGTIAQSDNANPNEFWWSSTSSGQVAMSCYAGSNNIYSTATLPTDGTDFSTGMRYKNSDSTGDCALWYGVAGSAGSFTGATNTGGWTASDNGLKYLFNNSGSSRDLACKCILFAAFNTKSISNSDFAALHSDPIGTLFDGAGASAAAVPILMSHYQ